uniref:Uncharacterized protein n=1 Tax=Rhodnius prolixus TaxID=13249 RepID=T1HJ11_RHOPR
MTITDTTTNSLIEGRSYPVITLPKSSPRISYSLQKRENREATGVLVVWEDDLKGDVMINGRPEDCNESASSDENFCSEFAQTVFPDLCGWLDLKHPVLDGDITLSELQIAIGVLSEIPSSSFCSSSCLNRSQSTGPLIRDGLEGIVLGCMSSTRMTGE